MPTISLQDVIREFDFEQCFLICDTEGGEGDLVHHEADILRKRVKTLMVEVHDWILGLEGTKNMFAKLERIGFVLVFQDADTYVFQNKFIDQLDFEENSSSNFSGGFSAREAGKLVGPLIGFFRRIL